MWQCISRAVSSAPNTAADTSSSRSDNDTSASAASSFSWSRISSYVCEKATDVAFELAPVEDDIAFLRTSAVLAHLAVLVYDSNADDVGQISYVDLPLLGNLRNRPSVGCKMLHFRHVSQAQELSSPQQFGIWEVDGLGIVIAFRGTASWHDVLIDVNVRPVPLSSEQVVGALHVADGLAGPDENLLLVTGVLPDTFVHSGFWEGARQHVADITRVVQQQNSEARHQLAVWVTGHSLGGGYANCMMLHLLANKRTKDLFSAGGGSITFGAPMVLYSQQPAQMYKQLQDLQKAAQGRRRTHKLQCHNYVNNADAVPRCLGSSLNAVHQAVETYVPSMSMVKEHSQCYLPFGLYHFIHGVSVRSLRQQPQGTSSRAITHAQYADQVCHHLHAKHLPKIAWLTRGQAGGLSDHRATAYQQRIKAHMDQIALDPPQNRVMHIVPSEPSDLPLSQLFDLTQNAEQRPSATHNALDEVAKVLGTTSKGAVSEWAPQLGTTILSAATSRWQTYWRLSSTSA